MTEEITVTHTGNSLYVYSAFQAFSQSSWNPKTGTVAIFPILQKRKLRHVEIKIVNRGQFWGGNRKEWGGIVKLVGENFVLSVMLGISQ